MKTGLSDTNGDAGANSRSVLRQMIDGFRLSQAIYVAVELGIADQLSRGPRSIADLACLTGARREALHRLLRALAAVGIFHEDEGQLFSLTPLAIGLCNGAPGSQRDWARYSVGPPAWQAWGRLLESVRSGESAFQRAHGMDVWRFRLENPGDAALFDAAMNESSEEIAALVLRAYEFGGFRHVVDVGGGNGVFLARLVAANSQSAGTLVDQAHVIEGASHIFQSAGVGDRCRAIAGNFFEALPTGGDAHLLKFILHNWTDDDALAILRIIRKSIEPHGRLLIIERTLAPPNEGVESKFADLNMLVHPGGKERTLSQYAGLLKAARFRLNAAIPLSGELALIEGVVL
jgi:hypothetical protein